MSSDWSSNPNQPPWSHTPSQPPTPTSPPTVIREDQVVQAIRFLRDSRTQSANQQDRESFLRHKGLSDAEIAAAISRSNASPNTFPETAIQRPIYVPPPVVEEPIIWSAIKSIFGAVGAVAIGVIGYQYYLESTKKEDDKRSNDLLSSWQPQSDHQVSVERFDRLAASVDALKAEQSLRHKELILAIRELTNTLRESPRGRKPGGTIVVDNLSNSTDVVEVSSFPLQRIIDEEIQEEPVDITIEVTKLRETGTDTTLQLVLSSLDKHKKLNKTNPRFEKLKCSKILRLVGFVENEEFWTLENPRQDEAERVLNEIKRQRQVDNAEQQLPPWLVPKQPSTAPEIEEVNT
jgi:hypothetical protein